MNNFPAMTEEQRQELITDCKEDISCARTLMLAAINIRDGVATAKWESQLRRQEIALAALTAEKRLTVSVVQKNERLKGFNFEGYDSLPAGEHEFYTAPSAPVLRVPDDVFEKAYNQHLNGLFCGDNNKAAAKQFLQDCINNQPAPPEASNEQ